MIAVDQLSAFLLDLYRAQRELSLEEFQPAALDRLHADLPFETACWGLLTVSDGGGRLHSSHVWGVEATRPWLELARRAAEQALVTGLGRTVQLRANDRRLQPRLRELLRICGASSGLMTVLPKAELDSCAFLGLFRAADEAAFNPAERRFKQTIAPHMIDAWQGNWLSHVERLQASRERQHAPMAVADQQGELHVAESRFRSLLLLEWPNWRGPALPAAIAERLGLQAVEIATTRLLITATPADGIYLLKLRPRAPADRLTPRERRVGEAFAEGLSYKEVARRLELSPSTVRSYLRTIYGKLEVSDKAALAGRLQQGRYGVADP